jgi:signal transduction histidine kinase
MSDVQAKDAATLKRISAAIERGLQQSDAGSVGRETDGGADTRYGEPLARLAHELKTPLSAIAAAAEIMRDQRLGPIDATYQGYAADIVESSRHALAVIAAMLGAEAERAARSPRSGGSDRSSAGAGSQANGANARDADIAVPALTFAEIDLNALVDSVGSSVRALLETVGLHHRVDLQPRLPHVVADPVAVRQILLNLVTNAMRATPAGGRITLSTRYTPPGPLVLSVADTGCGLTPEQIAAACTGHAVQRPSDGRSVGDVGDVGGAGTGGGPGLGLGLGLPTVVRFAALNGATVGIRSDIGHGTVVDIVFETSRVVPV